MSEHRYRAAPASLLIVEPLDSLIAIHHRSSGQTHLVASPVPEMLELLGEAPLAASALLDRLVAAFDLADPDAAALGARLDELVASGLVERI